MDVDEDVDEEEHERADVHDYVQIYVDTSVGADEDPDVHVGANEKELERKPWISIKV